MRLRRLCVGSVLAFGSFGCHGQPLLVGEDRDPSGSARGSSLAGGPDFAQQCSDFAALRAGDTDCWPTRHVGGWHGFVTGPAVYEDALGNRLAYPSNDVLLVIDEAGTGTVTFASANTGALHDAGADAALPGAEDAGTYRTPETNSDGGSTRGGLLEDVAYVLSELRMSGGPNEGRQLDPRVDFWISLAQPHLAAQQAAMDRADSTSAADNDAGTPADTLQASLSLSEDGNALRGTLTSPRTDQTLSTGFELIRQ